MLDGKSIANTPEVNVDMTPRYVTCDSIHRTLSKRAIMQNVLSITRILIKEIFTTTQVIQAPRNSHHIRVIFHIE